MGQATFEDMILFDDDLHNVEEAEAHLHQKSASCAAKATYHYHYRAPGMSVADWNVPLKRVLFLQARHLAEAKAGVAAFHAPAGLNKAAVQKVAELIGLTGQSD